MSSTSTRQRRIVWATVLTTVGLTAILVSQGTTQMLAASLLPLDASAVAPAPLGEVTPAARVTVDSMPILRRNIFDHETGPLDVLPSTDEPEPLPDDVEVEEIDPDAAPPCDGSMRLVGAFVRVRNPDDSFAAITSASGESLLYQAGMTIDEREVVAIQHNRVILRPRGQSICALNMFESDPRVATAATTPARPAVRAVTPTERTPPGTPEGLNAQALESGITRVNDGEYSIERSLVDQLLTNQAALMRTARVIPHEEGGRVVGVKLYGIRRSSLLGRLGIQNGDMLRTINGYDMTAPDSALEAYARLRSADRITVNLARRGQDQTIDYQIR